MAALNGNGNGSSQSVMSILARARLGGVSSWRAGIALGVEPAELEAIERQLDQQARGRGAVTAPRAGYEPSGPGTRR